MIVVFDTRTRLRTFGVVLALLVGRGCLLAEPPSAAVGKDSVLLIALDAVPYFVVDQLARSEDLFATIGDPLPLISSFPSTTTVAFAGMFDDLGAPIPPGYEARFYDRDRGKLRGGGLISYNKIRASWRDFFDWKIKGTLRKAWGYARPLKFAPRETRALIQDFEQTLRSSDEPVEVFSYVSASDAVGHLKSPEALADMLRFLDSELRELRRRTDRPFRVVIYSDHGMDGTGAPLENVRKSVRKAIEAAGFRMRKKVRRDDDLVFVPYGLLSSLVAFTSEGRELEGAEAIAGVGGVALCASRDGEDAWHVVGREGVARIERRQHDGGTEWRYLESSADPLDYSGVVQKLGSAPDGWIDDRAWQEATLEHRFPDALHRIAGAFEWVENPASVVCSVDTGYMYGPAFTEITGRFTVGKLRYTHGALDRSQTLGFLVTDLELWKGQDSLRFDEVFEEFAESYGDRDRGERAHHRETSR